MPTTTTTLSGTGESLHDAPGPRPEQRAVITPVAIVRLSGLRGRAGGELAMAGVGATADQQVKAHREPSK